MPQYYPRVEASCLVNRVNTVSGFIRIAVFISNSTRILSRVRVRARQIRTVHFGTECSPSILVVDDHEEVRQGIPALLSPRAGWLICGEGSDGIEKTASQRGADGYFHAQDAGH
jgi:hypothetical protein